MNTNDISEVIIEVANRIPDDDNELVKNIAKYIQSLEIVTTQEPDFSRTAEQIIKSGEQRGCHEAGLVFVTLLRAKGRKDVIYIQTFEKEDLKKYDMRTGGNVGGHVFVKTNEGFIDSTSGEVTDNLPDQYIIGAQGFDSKDIGVSSKDLTDYLRLFLRIKKEQGW